MFYQLQTLLIVALLLLGTYELFHFTKLGEGFLNFRKFMAKQFLNL